ncbi:DNA-binding response regulator, LytR/AlgR family [Butyrivibrio sp. ob235]|uniref:hypothetical protein n=1 Tax=Butyrivibrio sp. ob235 TaxID=1761780 RepID=UPI0008CE744D|nr:hypothetical protein [Butyrivibrio sp. ob235]SEL45746.1 DNA-binding response regulator, LytR/AlgR family [Butyrivibrio sp. ob235]
MHIAVFDDNIADRKQMERLLRRQSDRYQKEGKEHFYIDLYGNIPALLRFPQVYDIIFIDMANPDEDDERFKTGMDVAKLLFEIGGMKNVVMCSSCHDYKTLAKEAGIYDELLFIDKQIRVKDLEEILTECEKRLGDPIPTLEMRGERQTIYARENDIICAEMIGENQLTVYLTDNRSINLITDIYNLFEQCAIFTAICPISQDAMINVNHIKDEGFGWVIMDTDKKLKVAFSYRGNIKEIRRRLAAKQKN